MKRSSFFGTRGSAPIIIASITVTLSSLAVIGLSSLLGDAARNAGREKEEASARYAIDASMENAFYDLSARSSQVQNGGYVVDRDASNYSWSRFGVDSTGVASWSLQNRAEMRTEFGDEYMVHPRKTLGTSADTEWNTVRARSESEVPLFVDNTSRSMCSDSEDC